MSFIEETASRFQITVVYKRSDEHDAYVIGFPGDYTIVLNPDIYPPRLNWRFCHELAHILLKHPESETISREMEWEADRLAADLMLPVEEFRPLIGITPFDQIKERFPHASWEAICRRWAELRPAVVTIFDNGRCTSRWAPEGFSYPTKATKVELELVNECYDSKTAISSQIDCLAMQAIYIDEDRGVLRVILLTELIE